MIPIFPARNASTFMIVLFGVLPLLVSSSTRCLASLPSVEPSTSISVLIENKPKPPLDPKWVFGQIIIIGNEVTPQRIILDRLDVYPGQRISLKALRAGRRILDCLGLFEEVTVSLDSHTERQIRDVRVIVRERPDAFVRLRLATCLRFLQGWRVGGLPAALISEGGSLLGAFFGLLHDLRRSSLTTPPPSSSP